MNMLFLRPASGLLIVSRCEVEVWHAPVAQYLGHATLEWGVCEAPFVKSGGMPDKLVSPFNDVAQGPEPQVTKGLVGLLSQGFQEAIVSGRMWHCVVKGFDMRCRTAADDAQPKPSSWPDEGVTTYNLPACKDLQADEKEVLRRARPPLRGWPLVQWGSWEVPSFLEAAPRGVASPHRALEPPGTCATPRASNYMLSRLEGWL